MLCLLLTETWYPTADGFFMKSGGLRVPLISFIILYFVMIPFLDSLLICCKKGHMRFKYTTQDFKNKKVHGPNCSREKHLLVVNKHLSKAINIMQFG